MQDWWNVQLWFCGEGGRIGVVCRQRAPFHVAEEVRLSSVLDWAG